MTQKRRKRWTSAGIVFVVLAIPGLILYRTIHHEFANRALIEAVHYRDLAAARSALDGGADPNLRYYQIDSIGSHTSFLDLLRNLFVKPPADSANPRRRVRPVMLVMAEDLGETDIVRLLLERGANPNTRKYSGVTPL